MPRRATDFVSYYARTRPHANAIEDVVTGHVITWTLLEDRVASLAGTLADDLGVVFGDRVAVLARQPAVEPEAYEFRPEEDVRL